jgi:hypothetical protein
MQDLNSVPSEVMAEAIRKMQQRNPHNLRYFQSNEGQIEFRQEIEDILRRETMQETGSYSAMVEDIKERLGVGDDPDYGASEIFSDILEHGADTGWSGFTYTVEIAEFYDQHEDALEDLIYEYAEDYGSRNAITAVGESPYGSHPYKTAVVWMALVQVARREIGL